MSLFPVFGFNSPAVLTYASTASTGDNETTYTFSSVSIGPNVPKLVIVGVVMNDRGSGDDTMTLASGTIAGGAATVTVTSNSGRDGAAIMQRVVTGGTTATITVTLGASAGKCAIGVWYLTGYESATAFDTDQGGRSAATSRAASLNVPSNGSVLMIGETDDMAGWSWDFGTENVNSSGVTDVYLVGNSTSNATAETGKTLTFAGPTSETAFAVASWR